MDHRGPARIDLGRLLAALGGVLLLVSLFLDWYGAANGDGGISAWNSFELVDVIFAVLALVAIAGALEPVFAARLPRIPDFLVRGAGPIALVLVVISIIDEPPVLLLVPDSDLEVGIWLALAATALMTIGALLGRVRVSFVVSPRDPAPDARRPAESGPGTAEPARSADPSAETRVMRKGSQPPGI